MHSFCFKTHTRVPYLVVLEVVDYADVNGARYVCPRGIVS
jgi:hypothetical protein